VSAFFALERSLQRRPNDISVLHLAALTSERLGLTSRAVEFARRCADILEAAYERSEDPETARKYAITQSTLARIQLVEGDFAAAISASDTVLTLVEKAEEEDGGERYEETIILRSQAYLVSGIANLLSEEIEAAISSFETGLEETPSKLKATTTQMTVLLAQTMWNLGTDESYEMAKTLLLQRLVIFFDSLP
jgi:superkiller protein 3